MRKRMGIVLIHDCYDISDYRYIINILYDVVGFYEEWLKEHGFNEKVQRRFYIRKRIGTDGIIIKINGIPNPEMFVNAIYYKNSSLLTENEPIIFIIDGKKKKINYEEGLFDWNSWVKLKLEELSKKGR